MTRKILYSPGFGAGWTTWHHGSDEEKLFMLTYQPFIDVLERGEKITDFHEMNFLADFRERFPDAEEPYLGGVGSLDVATVTGRVLIEEYDGSESYREESNTEGYL